MRSVPTTSIDLTDPDVIADPYPHFAREREQHAVAWHETSGSYLTFAHSTVGQVQRDRRLGRIWHDKEPLDHLEPFVKESTKATPRIDNKLVLEVAKNFVPQTNIGRHPNQDAMLDAINPQLLELWKNAIAPGPMLSGLKSQLQSMIGQR